LKVTGQDGSVVHFKIKKNTPLRKLMSAYCERTVRMDDIYTISLLTVSHSMWLLYVLLKMFSHKLNVIKCKLVSEWAY